jgi:hypothetical protein
MRDALGEVTADKALCDHFVALENTTRHKPMTCEAKITQRTKQHHPYTLKRDFIARTIAMLGRVRMRGSNQPEGAYFNYVKPVQQRP